MITTVIRARRLERFGHLARVPCNTAIKEIFVGVSMGIDHQDGATAIYGQCKMISGGIECGWKRLSRDRKKLRRSWCAIGSKLSF